jgi:hypothetical protein
MKYLSLFHIIRNNLEILWIFLSAFSIIRRIKIKMATFYDLNMNSKRITDCQDPSAAQDVVTKNYADRNLTLNTQTASYALVASDRNKRVIMDSSSSTNITVNSGVFTEGDTVFIANKGTGTTTIIDGSGVTVGSSGGKELVQYRSGLLLSFSSTLFSFFPSSGPLPVFLIEYLVIAGGGGGGSGIADRSNGGAGGAGGYRCSVTGETTGGGGSAETPITVTYNQIYTITVGNGGASDTVGQNSSIVNITTSVSVVSTGGGFGAGTNLGNGGDGGSSGGGSGGAALPPPNPSNPGIRTASPIQGFNGGVGEGVNPFRGGGGGGAGEAGNTDGQGDGGDGIFSSITGVSVQRGGGGSGGSSGAVPTAGAGGGGTGSATGVGGAGVANTGGGGGGGFNLGSAAGGAGGKGIVILRTPSTAPTATTLTIGTYDGSVSGYKIYTFLSSGTIAWS